MRLVVETGAGTPGANAYATVAFVTEYLQARARETENGWIEKSNELLEGAVISATDYIERRWGPFIPGAPLRPLIPGRPARGFLDLAGNALNLETFTLGSVGYRLVSSIAQENDVLIGVDAAETIESLFAAINGGDGIGVAYHESTRANLQAFALLDEIDVSYLHVFAYVDGENGNEIQIATTITGAAVSGAKLSGGLDTGSQPLSFPKYDLFAPRLIVGVPLKVKQATAEYAVRALGAALTIDPTLSTTGALVKRLREKVGPIEEETEYVEGGRIQSWMSYPAADAMLADFVVSGGGRTYR